MNKKLLGTALVAAPLAVGGLVYATADRTPAERPDRPTAVEEGYVCPATGEVLPCQDCCPLKQD